MAPVSFETDTGRTASMHLPAGCLASRGDEDLAEFLRVAVARRGRQQRGVILDDEGGIDHSLIAVTGRGAENVREVGPVSPLANDVGGEQAVARNFSPSSTGPSDRAMRRTASSGS